MVKEDENECNTDVNSNDFSHVAKEVEPKIMPSELTKKAAQNDFTKHSVPKKPSKSVTLIDNIKGNDGFEYRKEDYSRKQKDNKCLRGILKSTSSNNDGLTNTTNEPTFTPVYNVIKTEEPQIPNSCPRYFGIKSYIDSFYYPPDSDVLNSGEFIQDDFEFVVEPGKRRWKNCWFKIGLWSGINLLLLGIIALLVGHLTPPRETIVARVDNLEVLDRSAITFNSRLHLCRLSGITIFCVGGIILMLTLLISSYQQDPSYYIMNTAIIPDMFSRIQGHEYDQKSWGAKIPLSGTLKPVQPR